VYKDEMKEKKRDIKKWPFILMSFFILYSLSLILFKNIYIQNFFEKFPINFSFMKKEEKIF